MLPKRKSLYFIINATVPFVLPISNESIRASPTRIPVPQTGPLPDNYKVPKHLQDIESRPI